MGSYCDRCNMLCGTISTSHLKQLDIWDLCEKCFTEEHNIVLKDVKKHTKYNTIGPLYGTN